MTGTLYIVATPIGNYEDITFRALTTLKTSDIILYEEHREGKRLLAQFGIEGKEVECLNEHNEESASSEIIGYLASGKNVALISDAGTPVFSDPGHLLVRKAVEAGIRIVPVPGASSLVPALTISGLPTDRFLFYGFCSPKAPVRLAELRRLKTENRTVVFMDAPYRLTAVMRDMAEVFGGERTLSVAFNLTMPDEQIFRGTAMELYCICEQKNLKGEFVIVLEGARR